MVNTKKMLAKLPDLENFERDMLYYNLGKGSEELRVIEKALNIRLVDDNYVYISLMAKNSLPSECIANMFHDPLSKEMNNKYQKWLASNIFFNIFQNIESFTEDISVMEVPKDMFSEDEATLLLSKIREYLHWLGCDIRRVDTHTFVSQWKKEYILEEEAPSTSLGKKLNKDYCDETKKRMKEKLNKEILEQLEIPFIEECREKIKMGEDIFTDITFGIPNGRFKEQGNLPKLVQLFKTIYPESPQTHIFIAEIYYRCGLVQKSSEILKKTLSLEKIDDITLSRVKRIQGLLETKKPKARFRLEEEFVGKYCTYEDDEKKYIDKDEERD